MDENNLIVVFYIDIRQIALNDVDYYMSTISKRIKLDNENNLNQLFIPIYGTSKVECINPVYIKDDELIKKHERLMAELHEHLNNQLNGK